MTSCACFKYIFPFHVTGTSSVKRSIMGSGWDGSYGTRSGGESVKTLCGVMGKLGYEVAYAAGCWQLVREEDGSEIALMTAGETGLCEGAMGSADGVVFLTDAQSRVYAYAGEAWVSTPLLESLGVTVLDVNGTPVIH